MAWITPQYSKGRVNRAGQCLAFPEGRSEEELTTAHEVLNNWRSSHSFPLNTIQNGIRRHARQVYPSALIAQRLKRSPSTINKLRLIKGMNLARMQDIGGCRAVLRTVLEVYRVSVDYLQSNIRHEIVRVDNYINKPKPSGYRSLHIVAKYKSDKSTNFNGLLVEIQLRTITQHAWATAVEIIDIVKGTTLKSNKGPDKWRQFFKYMGSIFADVEGTSKVPYTPLDRRILYGKTLSLAEELKVKENLSYYGTVFKVVGVRSIDVAYYILFLDVDAYTLTVFEYKRNELEKANADYLLNEKQVQNDPRKDVVLVAASALSRAYPNYFMNSRVFIEKMDAAFARYKT